VAKKASNTPISYDTAHRIIVMAGPERFLAEEYTRRFIEALAEKFGGVEQFNFDETVQPAVVLDELRSYGLMQKHKVVILDNAAAFLAGGKGMVEEDDDDVESESSGGDESGEKKGPSIARKLMEKYAANPVDDATLILRSSIWRPSNLDKLIAKAGGLVVSCEEQSDDKAAGWCVKRAEKEYEVSMEPAAASLLVQRIGPKLLHLDTELSKLASMAGAGKPITRQLVADAVEMSREEKVWIIQEAIVTRDPAAMLRKLTDLLGLVARPEQVVVPVNWAVTDLMRKLHLTARLIQQGMPPGGIFSKARLWGQTGHAIMAIAREHEPAKFAQLLHLAAENDRASKTGMGESVRSLEALLVTIADRLQSVKRQN
jgi:DNA polymerase III delta subunit